MKLDQMAPLAHYWDGNGVEVVSLQSLSTIFLAGTFAEEFVGPKSDEFLTL